MISKKLAIQVLNEALSTGADYAEIFYEDSRSHTVVIENGKVETSSSNSLCGVGLRLLKENQCVYGYTNNLSKRGLLALANSLNKSFNGERLITVEKFVAIRSKNRNPIIRSYNDVPVEEKIALLREGVDEINSLKDPRIVRTFANFADTHRFVAVFNSKGKWFKRASEFGRMAFQVIAADQSGFETGFDAPGAQQGIDYFKTEKVNPRKSARKAAEIALKMLTAAECPSGKMPVVIGNGWGGVLFHEACGHPLEASSVAKGLSCFSNNKMGDMIASPIVSAIDDSTMPSEWGSIDIDDEGNLGTKRRLIKNGKLNDFMIDDFNGRRMGREGNGACRRQNYRFVPTSRMSNTYICNGKSTPEEVIGATKLGLYAVGFSGGSVDPTTGEFNFGCSEAYIIRDGKIAEPVKGATLIGKGFEILKKIDMVANDLDFSQGMCGASSGAIRTNVGQPTLRVSEVVVGGRGGELK
ncbi:MAG: TldD/PmbA family protein [Erysipelotrichia bacterium]|nr:TldD/PmbA family protein [Erysipelotrichia bacterium]